ncbi:hypothetical protein ACLKA6_004992 [Drosophila palustris]
MKFVIWFLMLFIVVQLRISSDAASINFPLLRKSDNDKNHKKLNYTQLIPHFRLVPYVSFYHYRLQQFVACSNALPNAPAAKPLKCNYGHKRATKLV